MFVEKVSIALILASLIIIQVNAGNTSNAGNVVIDVNKPILQKAPDSYINLLVNGDFQSPSIKNQFEILKNLSGWEIDLIEKGKGSFYNPRWGPNQVIHLDVIENRFIRQSLKLDNGLHVLKVKYAAKAGFVSSSALSIFLNYKKIKQIYAIDEEINNLQLPFYIFGVDNVLQIRGQGKSDGHGMTISDLKLERVNLIKNGDFKLPQITTNWVHITNLPNWEVIQTEKGKGSFYNHRWGAKEVIELDSNRNIFIRQRMVLTKGNYVFQLDYASRVNYVHTSGMSVHWNGKLQKLIMAKDEEIHTLELLLEGVEGQNVIEIRGQGDSDHYGMCIANVRLFNQEVFDRYTKKVKQLNEPHNFIQNGDFREVNLKLDTQFVTILPGWETKSVEIGKGQIYNFRWDSTRVLKLDDKANSFIRQKIILTKGPYLFRITYALDAGYSDLASILIFWNGKKVKEILSVNNEEIHTLQVKIYASEGQNIIEIRGEGASDRRGFSIANIMLLSDLPSAYLLSSDDNVVASSASRIEGNLLKNGNFSNPPIYNGYELIKSLPQWKIEQASQAEKGRGSTYNARWGDIQVLELDGTKNYAISQKIQLKSGKYTFRMLYSAKSGRVQTSGMSIHWNGKKMTEIIAQNQFIHEYQAVFDAVDGDNLLMIRGESASDRQGMAIANLRLTKEQIKLNDNLGIPKKNLINNPNFILPPVIGAFWKCFDDIASWANTHMIQKGDGKVYNFRWGELQVLELDAYENYGIKQSFSLKKQPYIFRLRYAAKAGLVQTSAMSIHWNNLKIKQVYTKDEDLHELALTIQAQEGENILEIRGEGKSDRYGISICNLQLNSLLRPSQIPQSVENINYLKNPSFLEPPIKGQFQYIKALQGWEIALAQKGKGVYYNQKWGKNKYVLQLDVDSNNFIRQNVELSKGIYRFKLKHAARLNGKDTSAMQIFWNGKNIKEVIATDEEIHNLQLGLEAVEGTNMIQIRGSGKSDGLGMAISDLELFYASFLRNGKFAQPPIKKDWEYITTLPYWQIKVGQKGKGSFYNYRWNKTEVLELDSDQNYAILQRVQLRKGFYVFRFNYAAKIHYVATSGLSVFWNGIKIYQIFSNDQQIHQISLHIQAIEGENVLQIKGQGPSDHFGITIGNLQLFRLFENYNEDLSFSDTDTNLIQNPNFFEPQIQTQKQILQKLPGWETTVIQKGIGMFYNSRWGEKQIVKLDVQQNVSIKQRIQLQKGFYKFGMEYVAKSVNMGFSLLWNSNKILQIFGNNEEIHQFEVYLVGIGGQNMLQIRNEGTGDSNGLTITSLRLHPSQNAIASPLPQEIINSNALKNRKFQLPALAKDKDGLYFDSFSDWQTTRIKKSRGISYSPKWGGNLEVIQLIGKSKDHIMQKMTLSKGIYIFGIKYGARKDCIGVCGMSLYWNGNKVLEIFASDEDIHEFQMSLSSIEGENELQIRGQGKSDTTYGLAIADLRLNKLNQCPSYITF